MRIVTSVQSGSWKTNGLISSGQCDYQEWSWNEWSWHAFMHFILQRNQCLTQFEKPGLSNSSIVFCLTTIRSPHQDFLSDKFDWCLEEESGEYRAETAELTFRRFPIMWIAASYRIGNCQQFYFNSLLCGTSGRKCSRLYGKVLSFSELYTDWKLWLSLLVFLLFAMVIRWWQYYLEVGTEDL